jgi:hypothetical protein
MDHEWKAPTPEELRQEAARLRTLASCVFNRELAQRLQKEATGLLAQAETESRLSH